MAFFTCCHFRRSHLFIFLVQLYKFKIIRIAACFLIIESIDAHVGFLHLLGSIVKRGGGVLHGCYCHYHIGSEDCTVRAFKALRLDLKYLAHIIRKTKCYRFTKRNVPKRKTKRLRYRCPPEPYSNSVRTDFFSYSNAIILENQQINTSI